MSYYIEYGGESDTGRGPSANLWHDCPVLDLMLNPGRGFLFVDDFLDLPTGKYTATQATAGTFALGDAVGGVALADCNSTTSTQGINVQLGGTAGEIITPTANHVVWFESRVKAADIATGPEFFLGLHVSDTTIIASSDLDDGTTDSYAGFLSVTDDGVLVTATANGTSQTIGTATAHTFVDDTYVKLGMKITGTSKVEFYVNGLLKETVTTTIPATDLRPSLVCQSAGTTDPIVHVDWIHVGQQIAGN